MTEPTRHQTPGRGGSAPIGNEPRVPLSVRIDADLDRRARERAGRRGLSELVNKALRAYLDD